MIDCDVQGPAVGKYYFNRLSRRVIDQRYFFLFFILSNITINDSMHVVALPGEDIDTFTLHTLGGVRPHFEANLEEFVRQTMGTN